MGQQEELRRRANRLMETLRSQQDEVKQGQGKAVSTSVTRLDAPGVDLVGLGKALVRWYESQGYEAQALPQADKLVVQCRNRGRWKVAVGMSLSLTVMLRRDGTELVIEISGAKWLDKGVLTGLGMVVSPVFIAPAAWGAWVQARMPDRTVDFLKATVPDHLGEGSGAPAPAPTEASTTPRPAPDRPAGTSLDLNTAGAAEIGALPGVGLVLGKKAVREREDRGGFTSVDDFARVMGSSLKPHLLEQLRPRLTVGPLPAPAAGNGRAHAGGRRIED